jgi:hypothetical protein
MILNTDHSMLIEYPRPRKTLSFITLRPPRSRTFIGVKTKWHNRLVSYIWDSIAGDADCSRPGAMLECTPSLWGYLELVGVSDRMAIVEYSHVYDEPIKDMKNFENTDFPISSSMSLKSRDVDWWQRMDVQVRFSFSVGSTASNLWPTVGFGSATPQPGIYHLQSSMRKHPIDDSIDDNDTTANDTFSFRFKIRC